MTTFTCFPHKLDLEEIMVLMR